MQCLILNTKGGEIISANIMSEDQHPLEREFSQRDCPERHRCGSKYNIIKMMETA